MATLSSTLALQDRFTSVIQRTINVMGDMVSTMETVNAGMDALAADDAFATMRTDISLAQHALDGLNDELGRTEEQTAHIHRASSGFGGLSKAILIANQSLQLLTTTWGALESLGDRADMRISVDARLGLIRDDSHTQEMLEAQVMQAALDSRSSYESTAALVSRMGRQDYFKGSNDAAIRFASTLNKGLVVSGASTAEADSALTQLSQGLASGVLRGEEFNSVMENGSVIAEMMADSLGVTKGELREMAEKGQLTTDVVVSSIMQQEAAIEEQFASMPSTFGQASTAFQNYVSQLMGTLSQPGQAVDVLISKMEELATWAATADGQQFFIGLANGATFAVNMLALLGGTVADVYGFFTTNWTDIEPYVVSLGVAVGILTTAFLVYKGVVAATAAIELISSIAKVAHAGAAYQTTAATAAQTVAQYGLNAALLACPITWIVMGIALIVAVFAGLFLAIRKATIQSEEFNAKAAVAAGAVAATFVDLYVRIYNWVAGIWNAFSAFIDFFGNVFSDPVYAVKYLFYDLAVTVIGYIQTMAERIETLVNRIPGVKVNLTAGLGEMVEELQAAQEALTTDADDIIHSSRMEYKSAAAESANAYNKASDWVHGLYDPTAAEAPADAAPLLPDFSGGAQDYEFPPVELSGGSIDKVGKIGSEVDISDQSLEYLHDIAEIQALNEVNAYASQKYLTMDYSVADQSYLMQDYSSTLNSYITEDHSTVDLDPEDASLDPASADLIKSNANRKQNVYYLDYQGGVTINVDANKDGLSWEEMRQQIQDEADSEIESGLSDLEEVLY